MSSYFERGVRTVIIRPPIAKKLSSQAKSSSRISCDRAGSFKKISRNNSSVSPRISALEGLIIPAFSLAICSTVGPAYSMWSRAMFVITATSEAITFVASHRPSMPTSTTATSTASSANQRNIAAVMISKKLGRIAERISRSAIAPICNPNSVSSIGSPLMQIRSLIRLI